MIRYGWENRETRGKTGGGETEGKQMEEEIK